MDVAMMVLFKQVSVDIKSRQASQLDNDDVFPQSEDL